MPHAKYEQTASGAIESANDDARAVKFYEVGAPHGAGRCFLHPSGVLYEEAVYEQARWLVFTTKSVAHGDKTHVRDVTAVSPLALLLFGGDVEVHHDHGTVTIDGHRDLTIEAPGRVAVLVRELRGRLDVLLRDKIAQPSLDIASHPVLGAIVNLLTTERAAFT